MRKPLLLTDSKQLTGEKKPVSTLFSSLIKTALKKQFLVNFCTCAATYDVILRINSAFSKGIPFLLWPLGLDFRQRQTSLVSMDSPEPEGLESGFTFSLGRPDPEIFN